MMSYICEIQMKIDKLLDETGKAYLLFSFPENKKSISKLTHEQKLEWYAYQFQTKPQESAVNLSSKEFQRYWFWQVLFKIKCIRLFYRIKNFQFLKKYPHITEMKKKVKKHGI